MPVGTRSAGRASNPDPSTPAKKDSIPQQPRKGRVHASKDRPPPIQEENHGKRTKDLESTPETPKAAPHKRKRAQYVSSEGSETDEDSPIRPTSRFSLKKDSTTAVASPTSKSNNGTAAGVIPPIEVRLMEFSLLENMAAKNLVEILASKNIIAHKAENQGFSALEVTVPEDQAEVCWESITRFPFSKLPDTSKLGECCVFAIEATNKENFEESARTFLVNNMGSKSMRRCMALVLHHDSSGKLQPKAIVSYWMGDSLYYCIKLEGEMANKIAMKLNETKDWRLQAPHKESSKRRRLGE
ncbi:hypothetical protein Q7P35_002265 [Cladosporium inversicolor]